jgi:phosphoesterase RecJ-like protein
MMVERSQPQEEDLAALNAWLSSVVTRGPIAVVAGKNGDMDTIGSAVALAATHPNLMACGVHLGRVAKGLVEHHNAPFRLLKPHQTAWPKHLAGVIVVDAAAPDQTGLILPPVPCCVIDHHATDAWVLGDQDLSVKWDVRSTTEVVSQFLDRYHQSSLTPAVCEFLLAGLLTDTARFRHATATSFATASALIERGGIDYQHFVQRLEDNDLSPSDRGAILRGLRRAETTEAGPWTVIRTSAGTLEGRLASLLNGLGADAVVVTRSRDGMTRLTVRAPRTSVLQGLHLGDVMSAMAVSVGGEGGGHDGAAGWSGELDPIAAETAFIDALARTPRRRGVQ